MKKLLFLVPLSLASALFVTGCGDCCSSHGGGADAAASAPLQFDTKALEQAFASAESGVKSAADKAIAAVKNADYSAAAAEAQKLLNDVKLTTQQKEALGKWLEQAKSAAAGAADKVGEAAQKAATEVKTALPGAK